MFLPSVRGTSPKITGPAPSAEESCPCLCSEHRRATAVWGALATAPTSGPACVDGVGLGSHVKNTARQTAATMVSGPPTAMTALGIRRLTT